MSDTNVPVSPFGTKLNGRAAIARYHLGRDDERAVRRVTALMREVKQENRIPFGVDGDGQPFSFTKWLDDYALKRAQNLTITADNNFTNIIHPEEHQQGK